MFQDHVVFYFIYCDEHKRPVVNRAGWKTWGRLVFGERADGGTSLIPENIFTALMPNILLFESWTGLPGLLVVFLSFFFPSKIKASIGGSV